MIGRLLGAFLRAVFLVIMIAFPALMLPSWASDSSHITLLVALLVGSLIFVEHVSEAPSIIEFRDAKPFNRIRAFGLAAAVVTLSLIFKDQTAPTEATRAIQSLWVIIGNMIDIPYSPIRLAVLMLPADASVEAVENLRTAAGVAYVLSLITLLVFVVVVHVFGWPARKGAFNVWLNLPMFDPTAGGDVVSRLRRDARVNQALGFLLPFMIPAVIKMAADFVDPIFLQNPQTLIWVMCAWAFLPASLLMRGIAFNKIANMIEDKRRRTYARNQEDGLLTV